MYLRRVARWSVVAALISHSAFAQQQPSFKTAVDLITVDVRVVDSSGNPVKGLGPNDFTVRVDGRIRPAKTLQLIDYSLFPDASTNTVPDATRRPSPAGAASAARPARTIFLVVDEANIRAGAARLAAEAAVTFIDRMAPQDRIGLLTIPFTSTRLEATTDRGPVKEALRRITGHLGPVATPLVQERSVGLSEAFALGNDKRTWAQVITRECLEKRGGENPEKRGEPTRECLDELEHVARALVSDTRERMLTSARSISSLIDASAQMPGPKTFVLLSQELPVGNTLTDRKDFESETARIANAAARAQATVYVLHLDTPLLDAETRLQPTSTGADIDLRSYGLEAVTALTGGRRLMISGRAEPAFERIARETSSSYILGFDAESGDRDGKPHTVTVTTSRPGLEVRARRLFSFVDRPAAPPAVTAPSSTLGDGRPTAATTTQRVAPASAAAGTVPAAGDPAVASARPSGPPAPVGVGSPATAGAATLEQVLQRMGDYVKAYGERAALFVATEKYTQRVSTEDGRNFPPRQLLAEFAIVKAGGPVGWLGFRDVLQVDGETLTDRRDRLVKLLSDTNGDVAEARRISNESARFNIGPISRNFNVPTTTLFFFHPANVSRFSFKQKGTKKIEGVETWVLDFKETRRPSMVMTREGKDVPCEGTVWVAPEDGTIVRTVVTFRGFADDRVLQGVREKSSQAAAPTAAQSPGPAVISTPAPVSQTPATPPSQPPAQTPSAPATGGGGSGQKTSSPVASGGSGPEHPPDRGMGPTPQQLFSNTFETRKLESLARIDVTYRRHDRFGMWLPSRMSELYEGAIPQGAKPPFMGQATTTADYSDFKQFSTSAKVTIPK